MYTSLLEHEGKRTFTRGNRTRTAATAVKIATKQDTNTNKNDTQYPTASNQLKKMQVDLPAKA